MSPTADAVGVVGADDPMTLSSPEPAEIARGRGRHRRNDLATTATSQAPSGESATKRGRCRRRSISVATSRSTASSPRNTSRNGRDGSNSPLGRRTLRLVRLDRRRSQSPSRSRSATRKAPSRRRQRTKSRGRDHQHDRLACVPDLQSALRPELAMDGEPKGG